MRLAVGTITNTPTVEMRKWRKRELSNLAQGPTASWWGQEGESTETRQCVPHAFTITLSTGGGEMPI